MKLAADIGGTKTLLRLIDDNGLVCKESHEDSGAYLSLETMLAGFLGAHHEVDSACLAVAGPVTELTSEHQTAQVTNLPWLLDSRNLSTSLDIKIVRLINDFQAVGYGLDSLNSSDLEYLQGGSPLPHAPRALIGAGTGLGEAISICEGNGSCHVLGTEGGHVDFAPLNEDQIDLLRYLTPKYGHVSYERVLSGRGLVNIFDFLLDTQAGSTNSDILDAMRNQDEAAVISRYALAGKDSLAVRALQMFASIYGAKAGNLALSCLPRGGLYIAGGIAAKNLPALQGGAFMEAFLNKGRMNRLLIDIPVAVIMNPEVGLLGAQALAQHMSEDQHERIG